MDHKEMQKDELIQLIDSDGHFNSNIPVKTDWQTYVNLLEHQAIFVLDNELRIIHANRAVELWGWCDVKDVTGIHVLNLIRANIEHNSEICELFLLDAHETIEWLSDAGDKDIPYRFSFYLNKETKNYYAIMVVTDLSEQNIINLSDEEDDTDLIRLSAYRLHQLANKLIHTEETERKRISSELHDSVGQILAALKYQVESVVMESKKSPRIRKNDIILEDILNNVTFALSELRRISVELRPSVLEELGLLMTLKWFSMEYNKVYTNLKVHLQLDITESEIPDENKATMYRIIQESMNNAAKHSNASNIYVCITKTDNGLLLKIIDDGSGFNVKKLKKGSGLGLNTMEERALKSNATFDIISSKKSGTEINIFWENS